MAYVEIDRNYQVRAAVVFPNVLADSVSVTPETRLEEAVGLARAINLDVAYREIVRLREIKPSAYFSRGFVDRVKPLFETEEIELMIVDASLTPIQQRNLEKALKIKVIDRTALILEIFGERAKTKEGRLQVELAHLTYQRSRLVRSWTHLERQRGGAGFLGGPGETQIELDRRIIDDKIVRIRKELEKVKKTRELQRSARKRIPYPVVALVGYTNAGKSTLFNCLSSAGVFAENLLFATLDPTMRRIRLPGGREVILSDTVGFISDLPHELIMSFRATLEEVLEADVIVHVRDIANENSLAQKKDVLNVLKSLGLKNIENESGYIEVLNKIDLLDEAGRRYLEENAARNANVVPLSAVSGEGTERFLRLVEDKLSAGFRMVEVTTDAADGKLISWIYKNTDVISAATKGEQMILRLTADDAAISKLKNKTPVRTLG
ncbi:MAG: GTPase HflX [Alphaproteobacteria bacterium]|nr:GTPase HflX [Alphaproteobacteria bacterium]